MRIFDVRWWGWVVGLSLSISIGQAETVLGPWTPLFKGIDHAVGTNTPGGEDLARCRWPTRCEWI